VELDGIEITMDDDSSDFTGMPFAKTVIHHNTFNMGGIYYWNYFCFTIPQNLLDGYVPTSGSISKRSMPTNGVAPFIRWISASPATKLMSVTPTSHIPSCCPSPILMA